MTAGGSALVVFAHPAPDRAPVHKTVLKQSKAFEGIEVRDLYELYPDFVIDIAAEQAALARPDLIVLQFPLHWFTPPALLVEWLDAVWLRGFAYGEGGNALAGRTLVAAFTTGARARDFEAGGLNRYSLGEFLRPLEQTARRCGLKWAEPFAINEAGYTGEKADKALVRVAERWRTRLEPLLADAAERRRLTEKVLA
jgi:glutathione-regulated potassium-efflux system ancillary protein KefG